MMRASGYAIETDLHSTPAWLVLAGFCMATSTSSRLGNPKPRQSASGKPREHHQRVFPPLLSQTPFAIHASQNQGRSDSPEAISKQGATGIGEGDVVGNDFRNCEVPLKRGDAVSVVLTRLPQRRQMIGAATDWQLFAAATRIAAIGIAACFRCLRVFFTLQPLR